LKLNERKCQQQEYDSKKRSLRSGAKDTTKNPDREKNSINKPNQYAKVKNSMKVEEELQADTQCFQYL
jgi:hypothetical protein